MKKLSVLLSALLLLVGLGACNKECKEEVVPEPTSLKLNQTAVTLKAGETSQLTATVEPKDHTYTVTFASDKEAVATVDAKGLITAVAEGTATITATVGKLTEKCVVTVTAKSENNPDNPGGGTTTGNELPLLKFDPQIDENAQKITDPEILAHEAKLGRVAKTISLGEGQVFDGFANTDLTITGAIYGLVLEQSGSAVIIAFSKETLADCPKTTAMLAEYGFTTLVDDRLQNGTPIKMGQKSDDPTVGVMLADAPNSALQSTVQIMFIKQLPKKDLPIAHAIMPAVKDFPSYTDLMTGDVAKIKAFETSLGLRTYNAQESKEAQVNLFFVTPEAKMAETNFAWVYYVGTPSEGPKFLNSQVNFIKNEEDFSDSKLKEWFAANGFGNNFKADKTFAYATDASGKIICQIFINDKRNAALLQIFEDDSAQSASQVRRLASEHYELMKASHLMMQTKSLKLQRQR